MELDVRPRLVERLNVIPDDQGRHFYMLTEHDGSIKILNTTGKRALELCDGLNTVSNICQVMAREFSVSVDVVSAEVLPFLRYAQKEGVLT